MPDRRIIFAGALILVGLLFLMIYKFGRSSSVEILKQSSDSKLYVIKLVNTNWYDTQIHLTPKHIVNLRSRQGNFLSGLPSEMYDRQKGRIDGKHYGYYKLGDLIDDMDSLISLVPKESGNLLLKSDHGETIELEVSLAR